MTEFTTNKNLKKKKKKINIIIPAAAKVISFHICATTFLHLSLVNFLLVYFGSS